MKKPKLLDAYAIMKWTQQEKGWGRIKTLMESAQKGKEELIMSQINLCEVYYRSIRILGKDMGRSFLDAFFQLPVSIIHPTDEIIWNSGEIKAEFAIPLADCFAVATALEHGATILTGDSDFKKTESLVPVEWI